MRAESWWLHSSSNTNWVTGILLYSEQMLDKSNKIAYSIKLDQDYDIQIIMIFLKLILFHSKLMKF